PNIDGTQGLINASQNTVPPAGVSISAPTNALRAVSNSTPLSQGGGTTRGGPRGYQAQVPRHSMTFSRGGGRQLPHQITFQDPVVRSEHYVEEEEEYVDPYHEEDTQRVHQVNTGDFNTTVPQFNRATTGTPRPTTPYQPRPQGQRTEYKKIPTNLCPRFGERYNARDFNTFEREFCQICIFYSVPDNEKLMRFMLHLEGAIQNHAQCYIDNNEREVTYADLVSELRRSFQRKVDVDEAENQLHGRKWNPYEVTIDEFLHDTRLLVQQAYPGEQRRWDTKTRACLCRALPIELERIVASNTKDINDLVEWVPTYTRTIIQGVQPAEDAELWVKKAYQAYKAKSNPQLKSSGEHTGEVSDHSRQTGDQQPNHAQSCRVCQSVMHRAANCPRDPNQQKNFSNMRQDRGYYSQNGQSTQRSQVTSGSQNYGQP
ncbi:MAG: hypothetical protein GY820_15990, partial [Gammaproteobacteria bacterium]|nr:hypothetical protein [Gammaproteobacteria bacterium]